MRRPKAGADDLDSCTRPKAAPDNKLRTGKGCEKLAIFFRLTPNAQSLIIQFCQKIRSFCRQFSGGDRLRNGAGCGNRPRGACRVRTNRPAYRRAGDAPCPRHCPRAIGFFVPRPRRWRCPTRRVARRPCRLFRLGRLVAGFPRFEFTGHVFAPRGAQFGDDARICCAVSQS